MKNLAGIFFKKRFTPYFAFECKVFADPRLNIIILSQMLVWQMPFYASPEW